jgi:hypothetical protein
LSISKLDIVREEVVARAGGATAGMIESPSSKAAVSISI